MSPLLNAAMRWKQARDAACDLNIHASEYRKKINDLSEAEDMLSKVVGRIMEDNNV